LETGGEDGVLDKKVWRRLLGLDDRTVIERVDFSDGADAVVVHVRPRRIRRTRCGRCGQKAPGYDQGEGRRQWRALDVGVLQCSVEADAPRVNCPTHGPTVGEVPWARHAARHTRAFDDTVAWLVLQCSKSAVVELMRIAWPSVGSILARVRADIDATVDRFADLRRIGIDEISYKRHHHYLTVVIDHDSGRLVWAEAGRDQATLGRFFDQLGPERCAAITHVSADGAEWIERVARKRCPEAVICADAFHVVRWAGEALDSVRRQVWNEAQGRRRATPGASRFDRKDGTGEAKALKKARFALWKNPEDLTVHQRSQLEWITTSHPSLWRAYLLKEGMRYVFAVKGEEGKEALNRWLSWAQRCRLPAFVELGRRIKSHRAAIDAALDSGLSNARTESTNTKIRLLTRIAFGFHSAEPLIALAMLSLGGHRPVLPGRG
jgi:transposase